MKGVCRCAVAGCLVLLACCSTGNADPASSFKLKRVFKSLGYSRKDVSAYWAKVRRAINTAFDRSFLASAQDVAPEQLYLLLQEGSLNVFTDNEKIRAEKASLTMAAELDALFNDGKLSKKNWITLRQTVRNFVCTWLADWLVGLEPVHFKTRVSVAQGELAALPNDAEEVCVTDDEQESSITLSNPYAVLGEDDEEDGDALQAQALDAAVVEEEAAEEAVVEEVDLALKHAKSLAKFAHVNRFAVLSLLDESLDGVEA